MERWKEFYTDEQLKHLQRIELQLLAVLKSVCSKLGIHYFAFGGTLIGAVRHKGFIPWDDDLDVAMLRADYDKFISEAYKFLPDEYELQTPYNTPKTPIFFTKLRLKDTTCVNHACYRLKMEHGIFIDIFPVDNIPDDDRSFHKQYRQWWRLNKLYLWRQCPYTNDIGVSPKLIIKKSIKYCLSFVLKILPRKYLVKRLDDVATRYNGIKTSRKGNLYYPRPVCIYYNLLPFEEGEFNGNSILLPGGWDQHLTAVYGDYMKLPPEEERFGHETYLLDFGKY